MTPSFENRLADALSFDISDSALRRLDTDLAAQLAGSRRQRRLGRLVAAVAVLAIAAPLAAVATAGIRYTENPFGVTDATAFQAEIDAAKQTVALPPGAEWPAFLTVTDKNAGYSRDGGRFWVESIAFCLWMDAWIADERAGQSAAAETERDTLLTVPTWSFYSSPFADQSYRDVLDKALAGVKANDTAAARDASQPACP
jgi:hypothetical protein